MSIKEQPESSGDFGTLFLFFPRTFSSSGPLLFKRVFELQAPDNGFSFFLEFLLFSLYSSIFILLLLGFNSLIINMRNQYYTDLYENRNGCHYQQNWRRHVIFVIGCSISQSHRLPKTQPIRKLCHGSQDCFWRQGRPGWVFKRFQTFSKGFKSFQNSSKSLQKVGQMVLQRFYHSFLKFSKVFKRFQKFSKLFQIFAKGWTNGSAKVLP